MSTEKDTLPGRDALELLDEWFPPDAEDLALRDMFRRQRRIADMISKARREKGLSQAALAKIVGTQRSGIARLENPSYKGYSLPTLEKVAAALDKVVVVQIVDPGTRISIHPPRRTKSKAMPARVTYYKAKGPKSEESALPPKGMSKDGKRKLDRLADVKL